MDLRPYRISADASHKLVSIYFEPVFWDMEVCKRFMGDCLSAVASLGAQGGDFLVLVDLRDAVIQSQDVYVKAQALIASNAALRIALIASTPRARMQTKRLLLRDNVMMFPDVPEAEAWLVGGLEQAA